MKKYTCFLILIALAAFSPVATLSAKQIITKDLSEELGNGDPHKTTQVVQKKLSYDDSERLAMYEHELQKLIGRVEVLEKQISNLSQNNQQNSGSLPNHTQSQQSAHSTQASPSVNESNSIVTEQGAATANIHNNVEDASAKTTTVVAANEIAAAADSGTAMGDKQTYEDALSTLKEAGALKDQEAKFAKLSEAENKFNAFMEKFPKSKFASSALFWVGESYYHRQDYNKAAINYLKSYKASKDVKGNSKAADSLLKLSLSLGELKKYKDACGMINKLEHEFPKRSDDSVKRGNDAKAKFGCSKILSQ